jgi:hypothetical protein
MRNLPGGTRTNVIPKEFLNTFSKASDGDGERVHRVKRTMNTIVSLSDFSFAVSMP